MKRFLYVHAANWQYEGVMDISNRCNFAFSRSFPDLLLNLFQKPKNKLKPKESSILISYNLKYFYIIHLYNHQFSLLF